jgi:hypothetical protein
LITNCCQYFPETPCGQFKAWLNLRIVKIILITLAILVENINVRINKAFILLTVFVSVILCIKNATRKLKYYLFAEDINWHVNCNINKKVKKWRL